MKKALLFFLSATFLISCAKSDHEHEFEGPSVRKVTFSTKSYDWNFENSNTQITYDASDKIGIVSKNHLVEVFHDYNGMIKWPLTDIDNDITLWYKYGENYLELFANVPQDGQVQFTSGMELDVVVFITDPDAIHTTKSMTDQNRYDYLNSIANQ